jgi:hypothetical protein
MTTETQASAGAPATLARRTGIGMERLRDTDCCRDCCRVISHRIETSRNES